MEVVEDVLGICGGKGVHDTGRQTTRQIRGIHREDELYGRVGDGWESTGGNNMGVENECVWEGCEVEGKVGRVVCVGGRVSVE